jgi:rsbT antagonist protein RsbS
MTEHVLGDGIVAAGPVLVSVLRQGSYLIASVHTALDDSEMVRFQRDLIGQIGEYRCRGVIIDVAALDVLDSFASRTLRNIAELARLRGATTVIVGIDPDVAFATVHLGAGTGSVHTALDLEEGLAYLDACAQPAHGSVRPRSATATATTSLRRDGAVPVPRRVPAEGQRGQSGGQRHSGDQPQGRHDAADDLLRDDLVGDDVAEGVVRGHDEDEQGE